MEDDDRHPSGPRDLAWFVVIGALGLGLRLAYARSYGAHPLGRLPWVDEGAYWTRAREILGGAWLPERPFYQDPLWPYLLAGLMRALRTEDVAPLRTALAALGALTPLVVCWAGRRGLGRAEGIVAGLAAAVCGPLIFTDGLLEKEGPAALGAALALVLTARAVEPGRGIVAALVAGLAWGMVSLLRANALVVAVLGACWWARGPGLPAGGRSRRRAAGFLAGVGLALSPATLINASVSRPPELILTTWQAGANFYIGNGPEATGTYVAPEFVEANPAREADDFRAEAWRRVGRRLSPGEVSRFWLARGLERWRDAPAASVRLLVKKVGLLAHDSEIPDNQDIAVVRLVAAPVLACGVLSFGWLSPWAALGLPRALRSPFGRFLVLSTAGGLASTALFFVVGRYRIPWMPGLILLAAAGAVDTWRRVAARRWASLAARMLLLAAPAAVLAWRPLPDPAPDRWGHAQIQLAMAYLGAGQLEPAIDALDDARALGPGPALRIRELLAEGPVHDRLATLGAPRPERAGASGREDALRRVRWLRLLPEGRDESRRRLEAARRADPGDRRIDREWGLWWLGEEETPAVRRRAAEGLARAARGPAGDPSAAIALALLTGDRRHLPHPPVSPPAVRPERLRLAVAILEGGR